MPLSGMPSKVKTESQIRITATSQELTEPKKKHRSRWGILITAAIVILIVAAIVFSVVFVKETPNQAWPLTGANPFTFEEVVDSKFRAEKFNGSWVSDNKIIYKRDKDLMILDVESLKSKVLVSRNILNKFRVFSHTVSPDNKYILLGYDREMWFRHSFLASYKILNLRSGRLTDVGPLISGTPARLMLAKWTRKGNSLVFVYHFNVFYQPTADSEEFLPLTTTGVPGTIINGHPDWVYEEEVLSSNDAMWMSPDDGKLAFAVFNDTNVPTMSFPLYGSPGAITSQYPIQATIRYPKPGRTNPTVNIYVVDLNKVVSKKKVEMMLVPPPEDISERDHYFTAVSWKDSDTISVIWLNRHQNISVVSLCSITKNKCMEALREEEPHGWIDMYVAPRFSSDGSKFLLILPVAAEVGGSYKHLVLVDVERKERMPLTSGQFVVSEILKWDEKNGVIYFIGAPASQPSRRNLYSVSDHVVGQQRPTCISCKLRDEECTYVSAGFSDTADYYYLNCEGRTVPWSYIFKTKGHNMVYLWSDNQNLHNTLAKKDQPEIIETKIKVGGHYDAEVKMFLPPGIDMSGDTKYPMIVNVYAGPDTQRIQDRWSIGWLHYLTTAKGIIYTFIDGRGSGMKGDSLLFEIYRRLGTVEVEDQINVTKQLQMTYSFIDHDHTAIWGWSYGGFTSAMALAKDTGGVFACGVSVAPVTSWIYYDSIYTERYMGLPYPTDNLNAYNNSDVTRHVENFRNKQFLLVHGTADDNVHYQQSMMLARALETADILFNQLSYPDEAHSLGRQHHHLYHSLWHFFSQCFEMSDS